MVIEYPNFEELRDKAKGTTPPQREAVYLNTVMEEGNDSKYTYEKKYKVSADYIENSNKIKITFKE